MKRILKLLLLEAWFLKKTILFIGVILTAFVAALLSVISVLLDVPSGMYEGLNTYADYYNLSVKHTDTSLVIPGGTPYQGIIDGITRYATLTGSLQYNTHPHNKLDPDEDEEPQEVAVAITVSGYAIPYAHAAETFAPYFNEAEGYAFPQHPGELTINKDIAKLAGVKIGDTITLSPDMFFDDPAAGRDFSKVEPQTYKVIGYVNTTRISKYNALNAGKVYLSSAHYYFIPEGEPTYSALYYYFRDSRVLHNAYLDLTRAGREAAMQYAVASQVENIAIAQAFFFAVTFVLGVLVLFILYSLIAIFYRQRKGMICRLKLLGATSRTVAAIYCTIAVLLVTVAVVLGTLFSMAFNLYFIDLCGQLFTKFSASFVSRFRPIVPFSVLLGLAAFTMILFFRVNHKIRNAAIAQEVRHE